MFTNSSLFVDSDRLNFGIHAFSILINIFWQLLFNQVEPSFDDAIFIRKKMMVYFVHQMWNGKTFI